MCVAKTTILNQSPSHPTKVEVLRTQLPHGQVGSTTSRKNPHRNMICQTVDLLSRSRPNRLREVIKNKVFKECVEQIQSGACKKVTKKCGHIFCAFSKRSFLLPSLPITFQKVDADITRLTSTITNLLPNLRILNATADLVS